MNSTDATEAALRRLRMLYTAVVKRIEMRKSGMNLPGNDLRFVEIQATWVQDLMKNLGYLEPQVFRFDIIKAFEQGGFPGVLHHLTKIAETVKEGQLK